MRRGWGRCGGCDCRGFGICMETAVVRGRWKKRVWGRFLGRDRGRGSCGVQLGGRIWFGEGEEGCTSGFWGWWEWCWCLGRAGGGGWELLGRLRD